MEALYDLIYLSEKEKNELRKTSNSCIYKVPKKLRVSGGDRYDPHVVCIGPYHHNTADNLKVTTNLKKDYVSSFIKGSTTPNDILKEMAEKIKEIQDEARLHYADSFNLSESEFRDLLLLDGCFIIGVLCREQLRNEHNWRKYDILFNNKSTVSSIRRDLVLLENQIPYSVLSALFDSITLPSRRVDPQMTTLKQHIMSFFAPILPAPILDSDPNETIQGKHILDLLRKHLIPKEAEVTLGVGTSELWEHTSCATDLEEAGVKFRRKDTNTGLLDISFEKGKFEIPPFCFGESWTVLFRNMIALEQCCGDYKDLITSYVRLMDNLVDSSSDVKLLKDQEIITGSSEEYETIANDINHLSKEALYDTFYFDLICQDVNKYRKNLWPRWRANFVRNYIHTPWTGVSAIAAILLLLLAIAQTIISVLSWRYPK